MITNTAGNQVVPVRWFPFLLLQVLLASCMTIKPMTIEVALQNTEAQTALVEVHEALLAVGFVEKEIPADLPRRVDRVYRHVESHVVGAGIDAFRQENRLVILLNQTDPPRDASPLAKETFRQVHEAVQNIFGQENVTVVEIHRSLR